MALSFLPGILSMLHLKLSILFHYAFRASRIMVRRPRASQGTEGKLLSTSYYLWWSRPTSSAACSMKDQLEDRQERLAFGELLERGVDPLLQSQELIDNNESCEVLNTNPSVEETDSQLCVRTVEMGTSIQTPYSVTLQNEEYFENSTKAETPKITQNLSRLSQSELLSSGSFSLQSSIPVWVSQICCINNI